MNIDPHILIVLLSGLAGAVIGAFSQHLGFFFQTYREDKRVLKKVLYNQLDLWRELRIADVSTLYPLLQKGYADELVRRGAPSEAVHSALEGLPSILIPIIKSLKIGDPDKILPRYQAAVDELALIAPLLAHQLSGKIQGDFREAFDQLQTSLEVDDREAYAPLLNQLSSESEDTLLRKSLASVTKDIYRVARRIHPWTWLAVWLDFRRREREMNVKIQNAAGAAVDLLISVQSLLPKGQNDKAPIGTGE
jgi:hypothetical protein